MRSTRKQWKRRDIYEKEIQGSKRERERGMMIRTKQIGKWMVGSRNPAHDSSRCPSKNWNISTANQKMGCGWLKETQTEKPLEWTRIESRKRKLVGDQLQRCEVGLRISSPTLGELHEGVCWTVLASIVISQVPH